MENGKGKSGFDTCQDIHEYTGHGLDDSLELNNAQDPWHR